MSKIYDLESLANPDNLSLIYFPDTGEPHIEQSLTELIEEIISLIKLELVPDTNSIAKRILDLNIIVEISASVNQEGIIIKLDYPFENITHAVYFNLEESLNTNLGTIKFVINGKEREILLRNKPLLTSYLNNGYYLLVYNNVYDKYLLEPIFAKDLGFLSFKKMEDGIFSNLIEQDDLYSFPYIDKNVSLKVEESLFYDLSEYLLFNSFSYTLKTIKTLISDTQVEGLTEIYIITRDVLGKNIISIPENNIFIPKNQTFYLYKN